MGFRNQEDNSRVVKGREAVSFCSVCSGEDCFLEASSSPGGEGCGRLGVEWISLARLGLVLSSGCGRRLRFWMAAATPGSLLS